MKYYRLAVQPEVKYVAGWGICRPGFPEEWTPCHNNNPTPEQWDSWASKAEDSKRRYYKAKNGTLCIRGDAWYWAVGENDDH